MKKFLENYGKLRKITEVGNRTEVFILQMKKSQRCKIAQKCVYFIKKITKVHNCRGFYLKVTKITEVNFRTEVYLFQVKNQRGP